MSVVDHSITERIARVLSLSPVSKAVEYNGIWTSWGEIGDAAREIGSELDAMDIPKDAPIGWVARNCTASVISFVGLLLASRPIAPLRPNQAAKGYCDEIRQQRLQAIVGSERDWGVPGAVEAARGAGSSGILIEDGERGFRISRVVGLEAAGPGPHRPNTPGMVMERMSSGTTGAPKRIPASTETFLSILRATERSQSRHADGALSIKSSPAIVHQPFSHTGGCFLLLLAIYQARPIIVFEKFDVGRWADVIAQYHIKSANLVPAMIQMILDAKVPVEKLSSLKAIRSGTAALDPAVQVEFEGRYGVPILIDFGASEFMGGLAQWSLEDHHRYARVKRGSVGRVREDVKLRAIDPETGEERPLGEIGLMEVWSPRFSPDWIRTNDFIRVDTDGFIYCHGRLDDAINRGGFKILPDDISPVIRQFPGIRDATLVAYPDQRLGEVPVAIIEVSEKEIDLKALETFLRERLPAYAVPVDFKFIDSFPRTSTLKISRPDLKKTLGLI